MEIPKYLSELTLKMYKESKKLDKDLSELDKIFRKHPEYLEPVDHYYEQLISGMSDVTEAMNFLVDIEDFA